MNALAKAASAMFPDIAQQVGTWNSVVEIADQRKNKRLTKEAIDARQRIRNPHFETTHSTRAAGIARKNRAKAEKAAAKALGDAVEKVILAKQAHMLVEDLEEATSPIDSSRKQTFSYEHQDVASFVEEMAERNVPPSSLARAPKPVNGRKNLQVLGRRPSCP